MITLKTLHEATEQQVFDQVARHLLTQNEKSMGEEGECLYRNHDNKKCAAGCLISDDEYNEHLEGASWSQLVNSSQVTSHHATLIHAMQYIHDQVKVDKWVQQLYALAANRNLNTSVLDEFK